MREDLPMAGEVLSCHRENGPRPFNSIYGAPELVAERKNRAKGKNLCRRQEEAAEKVCDPDFNRETWRK